MKKTIKNRLLSFVYAFKGIKELLKQPNARIHLIATVIVITLGFTLKVNKTEWYVLIICIGIVLTAEAFNTAIEKLTDMVSPDWNEKAGKAKDLAAAGVLLSAIAAFIIGLLIFIPKIIALINV